jgi:ABC-type multidrug transport system fused ATPase/permease subunit
MIFRSNEDFCKSVSTIRKMYEAFAIKNSMSDGIIEYPPVEEKGDIDLNGMSFEVRYVDSSHHQCPMLSYSLFIFTRNISFSYPGSQTATPALNDVSMSINSGQLVVIVGANGSGKSTLIKILSRLYDPTSGQVLIGEHSSIDYRVNDLRRASVILSQDTSIYPLSLSENIGLGYPAFSSDKDMIMEAAKDGGALEFIQKLNKGLDTILEPLIDIFISSNLFANRSHPLHEEMEKLEKTIKVSGGEHQRVAA